MEAPKITEGARRAMGLAQIANKVFAKETLKASAPNHKGFKIEMSDPDALSLSESKNAVQHIRLVPVEVGARGEALIVIGTVDPASSHVELRTYDHACAAYARSVPGVELPVARADYEAAYKRLVDFFEHQGIETKAAPIGELVEAKGAPARGNGAFFVAIVVGLVAIAAIALMLVTRRGH